MKCSNWPWLNEFAILSYKWHYITCICKKNEHKKKKTHTLVIITTVRLCVPSRVSFVNLQAGNDWIHPNRHLMVVQRHTLFMKRVCLYICHSRGLAWYRYMYIVATSVKNVEWRNLCSIVRMKIVVEFRLDQVDRHACWIFVC